MAFPFFGFFFLFLLRVSARVAWTNGGRSSKLYLRYQTEKISDRLNLMSQKCAGGFESLVTCVVFR